ncbi:Miniconductance mechanosensitive channel MscM precursor [Rubripirellula lacrimiformis]|uniref:Miniconductance mechanosensitive channel MscM n=2 Tax=Rubripirellula lacrimiformis TaxID=1930273 RepID=A0A517NEG1_9BACT|nr:Miniconductance mechanosensitive channel MscM precursor [Rubripirellula lacrimiformis]
MPRLGGNLHFAGYPRAAACPVWTWLMMAAIAASTCAVTATAQNITYSAPYSSTVYPSSSYPSSSYPSSSYPSQSYPSSSYPVTSYPSSSYPTNSYPSSGYVSGQSVIIESSPTVITGSSYPTSSYPSNSYPSTSYPATNHTSSGTTTNTSSSSLPQHGSSSQTTSTKSTDSRMQIPTLQPRTASTANDQSKSQADDGESPFRHNNAFRRDADSMDEADAQLISNRILPARSRYPINRGLEYDRQPENYLSPYRISMIQAARESANRFRQYAQTASPIAADVADQNAAFADQWAELATTYGELATRVTDAQNDLDSTSRDFDDVTAKITHYGLTPTVGMLLRHKKDQLAQWRVNDSMTLLAGGELSRSRQRQLEIEMVRYDGSDPAIESEEILKQAGLDPTHASRQLLLGDVQDLLRQRYHWVNSLRQGYQDYQQKLGELDSATTAAAQLTAEYQTLINRHITWIRSDEPLGFSDLSKIKGGLSALFDSRRSEAFGFSFGRKWNDNPIAGLGLMLSFILIFFARWRAKSWLVSIGARKRLEDASDSTRKLVAGILTILVAIAIPGQLYAIAYWLGSGIVSESTLNASTAIYAAALVAWFIEIPRQLLRNLGYIHKHVAVELPRRERASTYLSVIGFGLVLSAYLITLTGLIDHGMWRGSLTRFAFIATMMLVTWTFHLALRPTGGFLEPMIAKFGGAVIHRVRVLIYLAGIGFPLAMIGLSTLGYGFTANELIMRAIISMACMLTAATLWPGVKILSARAWHALTGAGPKSPSKDEYGTIPSQDEAHVTGALGEHFLELKHHLAFLCQCTLVVLAVVCFAWLWIDVFPNARMGNPVVWTIQDTVTQSALDATGQTTTHSITEETPITALHLLLAAATLFVAFQLAKLLPALFDALVLQRVSFDEGMEHFSLVLGRFLLFGVGCLVASNLVGIRWQTIQWLAVGLTIGLGFGLQDMVRNLFGGLIVLFEKPARLGDFISVGKVTGRIAAQKLRTTVLSDDEGREVIIPNKNFVSEEVVNWMGAGRLNVIPIEVAVTRDERPADICRLLYELVLEQDDVLLTPAPQATLVCIGQRSQRIEVRAWIEEGQDAHRFRDSLLTVTRRFLEERKLLAKNQPTQPSIHEAGDEPRRSPFHPKNARKRSA